MYNYVKESKKWQVTYMKPRIFISSTFYDLKYIREDLSNFVRQHDYEPIMFENGDIGYTPGKPLDKSCYESMKNSDMVILIIGGEYGSAATGETKDEFKEYMSITRNEFRTAIDAGIPVFVMIDKKVMAEYNVYELNCEEIENQGQRIKFSSVKSINVFRFIKEIRSMSTLPIQEFEKSSEIKDFIGKQWADMFKNYLASLRGEKEDKKIEGSVNELKDLIQQMGIMLNSVGKNVLSKESPEEYNNIVTMQEILSLCSIIVKSYFILFNDENGSDVLYKNLSLSKKKEISENCEEFIMDFLYMIRVMNKYKPMSKATVNKHRLNFKHKWGGEIYHKKFISKDIDEKIYYMLSENDTKKKFANILIKDEMFILLMEA